MALFKCSECGKEISDKATACISCGNPIHDQPAKDNENKKVAENEQIAHTIVLNEEMKLPWSVRFYGLTWLFILFLPILPFLTMGGKYAENTLSFISWVVIWLLLDYACVSYTVSENKIIINSGILIKKSQSIPFSSVQNVNNSRGPISTIFGASRINIWTASPSQIQISNGRSHNGPSGSLLLDRDDAEWLKEYITKNHGEIS